MANLPAQLTSFIGRDEQIEQAIRLLGSSRLLTLTGPGGVGKTRLALAIATVVRDRFQDGVVFVSLASVTDADNVASTIATVLGLQATSDVAPKDQLATFLRSRETLLVLDNFEHLLAATSLISDLLIECSALKMLITSRIALRIVGEQEAPVPPLALPDPDDNSSFDALAQSEAVALFIQRAQTSRPEFMLTANNGNAVVGICRRLDGLPLAIELAAARTRILTPQDLYRRLDHILPVLVGGARNLPARQRTISDTIAWSYNLLPSADQRLFRMLAMFPGGWSLECAEAVSDPNTNVLDSLTTLVDHNLARRTAQADGSTRYSMLETIREFGLEQLRTLGEDDEVYQRHLDFLLHAFSESERDWHTPQVAGWLRLGDAEKENVRFALEWAIANNPISGLRLARFFAWYWFMRGSVPESQRWLIQGLANAGNVPDDLRAHVLWGIGSNATILGDFTQARAAQEDARAIYSDLGDDVGVGNCLHGLSRIAHFSGDVDPAVDLYESAVEIFRQHHHPRLMVTLSNLGLALLQTKQLERASVVLDEALALAERHGHVWHVAQILNVQGDLALARGELPSARRLLRRCVQITYDAGDPRFLAQTFESCAWLATHEGAVSHAAQLIGAVARLRDTIGVPVPPLARRDYNRHLPVIEAQLGAEGWQHEWTIGYGLLLSNAIDVALEGLKDIPIVSPSQRGSLTDREIEVLRLIAGGRSNKEIASELCLSIRTVERHINNLYRKIDAQNKADATAFALRHDLA